jgi:hypothetical protein
MELIEGKVPNVDHIPYRLYSAKIHLLTSWIDCTIPGNVMRGIVSGILFEDEDRGPSDSLAQFGRCCEHVADYITDRLVWPA